MMQLGSLIQVFSAMPSTAGGAKGIQSGGADNSADALAALNGTNGDSGFVQAVRQFLEQSVMEPAGGQNDTAAGDMLADAPVPQDLLAADTDLAALIAFLTQAFPIEKINPGSIGDASLSGEAAQIEAMPQLGDLLSSLGGKSPDILFGKIVQTSGESGSQSDAWSGFILNHLAGKPDGEAKNGMLTALLSGNGNAGTEQNGPEQAILETLATGQKNSGLALGTLDGKNGSSPMPGADQQPAVAEMLKETQQQNVAAAGTPVEKDSTQPLRGMTRAGESNAMDLHATGRSTDRSDLEAEADDADPDRSSGEKKDHLAAARPEFMKMVSGDNSRSDTGAVDATRAIETTPATLSGNRAQAGAPVAGTAPAATGDSGFEKAVMDQIIQRAVLRNTAERSEMRIQLKPEVLGDVRLSIVSENQHLAVRMITDQAITKDIIESQLHHLRAELDRQGLIVEKVEVLVDTNSGQNPNREQFSQMFKDNSQTAGRNGGGGEDRQQRQHAPTEEQMHSESQPATGDGISYFA